MTKKIDNQKRIINMILIFLIALLAVSNGLTVYYLYLKNNEKPATEKVVVQKTEKPIVDNNVLNNNNEETQTMQNFLNNQNETAKEELEEETQDVEIAKEDLTEGKILVEWNQWPVASGYYSLFDDDYISQKVKNYNKINENAIHEIDIATENFFKDFEFYKTGKIKQGPYIGKDLYIITFSPEGPYYRDDMYRVIENGKIPILLSKYSDKPQYLFGEIVTQNDKIEIANLEPPAIIKIPDSKYNLIKKAEEPFLMMENIDNPLKLFKYDEENYIYKDVQRNCFVAKANDGTTREYNFQLDFIGKKGEETQYAQTIPYVLNITWLDGSKNNNEYVSQYIGGCGKQGCYDYPDYISGINQLEKTGELNNGDAVYEMKDDVMTSNDDKKFVLTNMYDLHYPAGYDSEAQETTQKISFEEFLATHPIIYWQDPFGDLMEFRNAEYTPAVECGKPVIYLYPQTRTDVSVWVNPTGGFSITEPVYNNGWKVSASPDSEIYNYGDQKVYLYLFWEGKGMNYSRPKEGFVVKKENVKEFLKEKLAKLGLIKKEYDEFIEFWLPKMQDRNYYFVTFVPKQEFDLLAPLTVKPKPDTIIRVFMDYEGLDEYIKVKEQELFTPQRKGFVVVEWGGALHK